MKLCNKHQFSRIYKSIINKDIPKALLDDFPEYLYSPSNVIETMLKNVFDLRGGTIDDTQLLKLIEKNHNNFVMTFENSGSEAGESDIFG